MPLDASGNYRHNHESAKMHSEVAGKKYETADTGKDQGHEDDGNSVSIHSHGDGTFHTDHGGEKTEHATHGHALIHAAKAHMEEGHKHFIAHHDGEMMHSHSAGSQGEEADSRDHEDEQGARDHMEEVMGTDEEEKPEEEDERPERDMAGKGLTGLY